MFLLIEGEILNVTTLQQNLTQELSRIVIRGL